MSIPHVLFIEDNDGDVTLMQAAFAECWPGVRLHRVASVARALRFLRREGEDAQAPEPSLLLLDLNLPGETGKALLEALRHNGPDQRRMPIIVFSSSCRPQDIEHCYKLGATLYVVKPNHWSGYVDLAASFAKVAALSG
jgi:two-component system response regulator